MPKKSTLKNKFKREVMDRVGGVCENPHCDADANSVHHLFKVSKYPEFQFDPDNGVALCGPCHAEVERRERMGVSVEDLLPDRARDAMEEKIKEAR